MHHRVRMILTLLGAVAALVIFVVAFQFIQSARVATSESTPASEGVQLTVTSASIPGDRKPVVSFSLTDSKGSPLRLSDLDGNPSFTIAVLQQESGTGRTYWENLTTSAARGANFTLNGKTTAPVLETVNRPGADSGGVFTDKGGGTYQYAFNRVLPQTVSNSSTMRIGGQVTRASRAYVSNSTLDFVPAGGAATSRVVVTTEACNRCHDPLSFHGGTRREVGLCVTCHTSQNIDPETGDTVEFRVMVHKIHRGVNLPSVKAGNPYFIVGYGQGVQDFSGIVWPQDTRNCTTCHTGPQGDVYKTQPSAEACGACHDNVNFKTGANHGGGAQPNTACKTCHPADGVEFDLSVSGSHAIPDKSKQLRGVNFEIVSVANAKPGQSPTVVFNIKDNVGQIIKPSEMSSLSFILGGPTTDYSMIPVSETATGATAGADGNFSFTMQTKIPADAQGTYAVGVQGILNQNLKKSSGETIVGRNIGFNKVAYAAVTGNVAFPRKQIVDVKNCNVCHDRLGLHGGSRVNTEFCVICHNPNNSDVVKRATAGGPQPPESIDFKRLIHKIHTGEEQNDKLTIYGGGSSNIRAIDLSEVVFPGDRRNCVKCHVAGSQLLSFARQNTIPTEVKVGGKVVSSIPPISAACTGCHDSGPAKTHAAAQTVNGAESCVVCHNEGREFAVSAVHAR
ncbi:MAG: OmcA/MtrC family decaheme c-type cytochrome [Dehalococcoidia bacterium]|nr:OmcA/MtrC family decaheme c-type cytochrome [Dehalococcoidia bacterium]